jgi:hypothetical protein
VRQPPVLASQNKLVLPRIPKHRHRTLYRAAAPPRPIVSIRAMSEHFAPTGRIPAKPGNFQTERRRKVMRDDRSFRLYLRRPPSAERQRQAQ